MTASERGETLVEIAVGILLLAAGALALAGGLAYGENARGRSTGDLLALSAAVSWLESWRVAPPASNPASGSEAVSWGARSGEIDWSTRRVGTCREEAIVRARAEPGAYVTIVTRRYRDIFCE